MSVPVVAFFNNKGGVGKTTLVYHLAWMFADSKLRVVAADLDPQANLTAALVDDERMEEIDSSEAQRPTIFGCVQPLKRGIGDIVSAQVENLDSRLGLILGDMALSTFEDQLSEVWPKCMDRDERAFRVTSAFWRILQNAAEERRADVILVDLGPNLGAINRAALIASDFVVVPLGPDLFSLQGMQNLGPALIAWRREWKERIEKNPAKDLALPPGSIAPIGYVVLRHSIRLDRPVQAFDKWIARIPGVYAESVLEKKPKKNVTVDTDEYCIAKLKDYRSLMPMAQEARKPMFFLKPGDGALGAHTYAVQDAYNDFLDVAKTIAKRAHLKMP